MTTALKIIVDDFADFHDMRRVQRDAHGIYTLVFDQRLVLNIEADPVSNIVCVFASPGSVRPSLHASGDAGEVEWHAITEDKIPFGGRIGVHYSSGMVMLDTQADPARLDTVTFRLWLMSFIDQLVYWSQQITPRSRVESLLQTVNEQSREPTQSAESNTTPQGSEA
jgi:hypothetical protein